MNTNHRSGNFDPTNLTAREDWNTDLGNADILLHLTDDGARYCHPQKSWYIWNGKRWQQDTNGSVGNSSAQISEQYFLEAGRLASAGKIKRAADISKMAIKAANVKVMNDATKASSLIAPHINLDETDPHPTILNVQNGLLDIETGELHDHNKDYLTTRVCQVDYDVTADCPTWDKFLIDIFPGDPEPDGLGGVYYPPDVPLIDYFQKAVGYTLSGYTTEQCLFFLYGSGANGKSTAMDVIALLLGDYSSKISMNVLQKSHMPQTPTELATLPGARFVLSSEVSEGKFFAEELAKDMTGGDTLSVRHLYGHWFQYRPVFKLWIYGNHKPRIKGTDWGIWRRIRIIPFSARFQGAEKDTAMPKKLEAELPGILNWAMEGYRRWKTEGMDLPDAVRETIEQYRSDEDIFGDFFAAAVNVSPFAKTTTNSDFYKAYCQWCKEQGVKYMQSPRIMASALDERGYQRRKGKPLAFFTAELNSEGERLLAAN